MAFRFYIDNLLVDQPMNDMELITTVRRDPVTSGINVTQDATLEWANMNDLPTGITSGYQYLKGLFDDGICNEAGIVIYDEVTNQSTFKVYTGIIKLTQLEFDEQRFFVKTKVQDNSFYAYLNNNRSLAVNLAASQSKNKENITPVSLYSLDLFNSNTCAYGSFIGALYHAYLLQDAFSIVVRGISDGLVSFQSDYLDSLTHQIFIAKGQDLLNPYTIFPLAQVPTYELSFEELIRETDVIRNVGYYMDESDPDNPVFRLEDSESLYTSTIAVTLSGVLQLRTYVDLSRLYGSVKVGANDDVDGTAPWLNWPDSTSYYGWKIEEFFPLGQCNTNAELDLVSNFHISNNVIQDTIVGGSTSHLDDYFFLQCQNVDDLALTADAVQFGFFSVGGCFYNLGLNNFRKMQRHSDKFETDFGNFLKTGGNGFKALLGDTLADNIIYSTNPADPNFIPATQTFFPFDAEYPNETTNGGYDGANNYNNVTFEYVIPADGDYSFHHRMRFTVSGMDDQGPIIIGTTRVRNNITLYDSVMSVIDSDFALQSYAHDGTYILDMTFVVQGVTGDIVKASYDISMPFLAFGRGNIFVDLSFNSFFEATGTPDGGITITNSNESTLRKLRYEFEYAINETDWRTIVANPTGMIAFEKDGVTRFGWIDEMKHNHKNGLTQIKLITNNALTT